MADNNGDLNRRGFQKINPIVTNSRVLDLLFSNQKSIFFLIPYLPSVSLPRISPQATRDVARVNHVLLVIARSIPSQLQNSIRIRMQLN